MSSEDFVKLHVLARVDFAATGTSPAAELAFYRGLQTCGLSNTHGIVLTADLPSLGPRRVAAELVDKGYWEPVPAGWRYRQWDKWQAELEQVQAKRARDAQRKRDERRAKREAALQEAADVA